MLDPELRALFDELHETTQAAVAALAADDGEAWLAAATRGAEIHEVLAQRNGWRAAPTPPPAPSVPDHPQEADRG
ncbi:hypothetical protein Sme01_03620 [Sphaerisporangium melleum]|uniref:Uncharacterized protein n=1 Tax=Sphaerisporangium melleum TaxID=321316 RepID=A0A917VC50_9ACTN|nr:hypothetical protein [Sphaerisporangium melleum]GGK61757.1 hypothetical protein GCM10007964_01170 [Sphaerisporangium melleum]GII67886.1 hypothetical protein Sme01_03620 [Sphaerisporangium melleum]